MTIATSPKVSNVGWTTDDERKFIRNIGKQAETGVSRFELLNLYIAAAAKRIRWGAIDKKLAIDYARLCQQTA